MNSEFLEDEIKEDSSLENIKTALLKEGGFPTFDFFKFFKRKNLLCPCGITPSNLNIFIVN